MLEIIEVFLQIPAVLRSLQEFQTRPQDSNLGVTVLGEENAVLTIPLRRFSGRQIDLIARQMVSFGESFNVSLEILVQENLSY